MVTDFPSCKNACWSTHNLLEKIQDRKNNPPPIQNAHLDPFRIMYLLTVDSDRLDIGATQVLSGAASKAVSIAGSIDLNCSFRVSGLEV